MPGIFLDTGYALALAFPRDQHHQRAAELALEYDHPATEIVTTSAVVLEIANSLATPALRPTGVEVIHGLLTDPRVTIIEVDQQLMDRGLVLFSSRPDKHWSLTDCISFLVMEDKQLVLALAYDQHFEQAGFRPLMRE